MDIYYVNTKNETIILSEWPIAVTDITQLFGRQWTISGNASVLSRRSKLSYITRTSSEFKLDISVYADSLEEFQNLMNHFEDVTDYDNRQEMPGRLYVGEFYLECWIRDTAPANFEELFETVDVQLTVEALYPHWVKEVFYQMLPTDDGGEDEPIPATIIPGTTPEPIDYPYIRTDYPYDYYYKRDWYIYAPERDFPYDYKSVKGLHSIDNPAYQGSNFVMTIYGYCANPQVIIGGNIYVVYVTLYENERLVINSIEKTITKIDAYGNETNVFNSRGKEYSVFEPIEPGTTVINWAGTFGIDLTIYDERSEPEWIF